MMITSSQSCGVIISYPDDYWGDLESLVITHNENSDALVVFHPRLIDVNGESKKCIEFDVPRPNQRELQWSEDKLSAVGHSTLTFKSNQTYTILQFYYSLHYGENQVIMGSSSMYVSAVSVGKKLIERESHPFNEKFIVDITELID